jgi:hypothetical protein
MRIGSHRSTHSQMDHRCDRDASRASRTSIFVGGPAAAICKLHQEVEGCLESVRHTMSRALGPPEGKVGWSSSVLDGMCTLKTDPRNPSSTVVPGTGADLSFR